MVANVAGSTKLIIKLLQTHVSGKDILSNDMKCCYQDIRPSWHEKQQENN
jgi:hypothetical protein